LHQNHPNPFNPRTTIAYAIGRDEHVSLRVYDVGGRRVATLVDEVEAPGLHVVPWDGTDDAGRALGSGVFFYELRVGDVTHTKKLLLLR
jgi:hypothetical protein